MTKLSERYSYKDMSLAKFSVAVLTACAGFFPFLYYILGGATTLKAFFAWWLPIALWFGLINLAFGPAIMRDYYKAIMSPKGMAQEVLASIGIHGPFLVELLGLIVWNLFDTLI